MTIQITVRLPDELVEFVDDEIRRGLAGSRADAVAKALVRERRRRRAMQDVAILQAEAPVDSDMDELARHTAAHPLPLDD